MTHQQLKDFLDEKAALYDQLKFIESDPIQIPHLFSRKEDIEIAGFLVATIAWGNRKSIINNGKKMMDLLGNSPYDFVMNHSKEDLKPLSHFVHRTFNGEDLTYFIKALQHIYSRRGGIETIFHTHAKEKSLQPAIHEFKKVFFSLPHLSRTEKHIGDPGRKSAAKRINMYLRWMVRPEKTGVDFGLWTSVAPSQLSCPLDVHSGGVARKLGLLKRKQNDAKALEELDASLRKLDPLDPVKYDFALFGLGAFEKF
ncbi:MAG: TIGR02757 family protein [Bacteroidota bacterium]